ncbi:unnamed protein product, partial [Brenthis ino]
MRVRRPFGTNRQHIDIESAESDHAYITCRPQSMQPSICTQTAVCTYNIEFAGFCHLQQKKQEGTPASCNAAAARRSRCALQSHHERHMRIIQPSNAGAALKPS